MKNKEKKIEESNEEETNLEEEGKLDDPLEKLQQEFDEAQREISSTLDGWQRTQAEFINYKKRMEREQIRMNENASIRVIKSFLGVIDDLDRAIANRPSEGEGADWAEGIDLVFRKMLTAIDNEGVKPMDPIGEQFDPNLHEAIMQAESEDHKSGEIIEVIQKGYLIGERILRPAMVKVAS